MKKTFIAALALLTTGAHASFDLMLIPGNNNRIYRYDPLNNVHLGSYGTQGDSNLIAADTRGISYSSMGSNSMQAIRYSSGEQVSVLQGSVVARAHELVGNYVYVLGSNNIRRTHITTGATSVVTSASSVDYHSMAAFGSNMILAGINTSNQMTITNFDLNTQTFGSSINSTFTVSSTSILGKGTIVQNPVTGAVSFLYTYSNTVNAVVMRMSLNGSGQITSNSFSSITLSNFAINSYMPSFSAGHGGGAWLFGRDSQSATNMRVTRFDLSAFGTPLEGETASFTALGGSFAGGGPDYVHAATVVAPEPGTIAALGLGLVALLRKRKKS